MYMTSNFSGKIKPLDLIEPSQTLLYNEQIQNLHGPKIDDFVKNFLTQNETLLFCAENRININS